VPSISLHISDVLESNVAMFIYFCTPNSLKHFCLDALEKKADSVITSVPALFLLTLKSFEILSITLSGGFPKIIDCVKSVCNVLISAFLFFQILSENVCSSVVHGLDIIL